MEWTFYFLIIFTLVGGSSSISDRAFRDLNTEVKLLKTSFQREIDALKFEVSDVRAELHLEKAKTARLEELLNGTGAIPEIDASLPTGVLYGNDVNDVEKLTEDVDKLKKEVSELSQAKKSLKKCEKDIRKNKVSIERVEEVTKNVSDVMRNEILKEERGMEACEKDVATLKTDIDTFKQVMTVMIGRAKKHDDDIVDIQRDIEGINDRANERVEDMANIQSDLQLMSEESLSDVIRNEILKKEHGMEAIKKDVATLKTGIDTLKQVMTVVIGRAKKHDDYITDMQRAIEGIHQKANESVKEMANMQRDLQLMSEETLSDVMRNELLKKEHGMEASEKDVATLKTGIDTLKQVMTVVIGRAKKHDDDIADMQRAIEGINERANESAEEMANIQSYVQLMSEDTLSDIMRNEILKEEHGMEASEKAVAALKTGIDTLKQVMTVVIGRAKKNDEDIVDIHRDIKGIYERSDESVEEMANIQSDLQLMSEETKNNTKHMKHVMDLLNEHESTIAQHTKALNWTRDQKGDVTTIAQHTKALPSTRDQIGDVTTIAQHTKALSSSHDQIGDVPTIAQHTKALPSTRHQIEYVTTTEPETDSQRECRRLIRAGGKGMAELLYEGATVKRGKDWEWYDQDGGGYGEVTYVGDLDTEWVKVTWENNTKNVYRMGVRSSYDLMIVEDKFDFSRC